LSCFQEFYTAAFATFENLRAICYCNLYQVLRKMQV